LDGVLVIDKPSGMTSHDVVDAVRRRLGTRKVGHAGTLDPDATGVLLIGIGRATRFLSYAQASPKRYEAAARFGIITTTQDASGEVVEERPAAFTRSMLEAALVRFSGVIEQVPPMVSAVKIGGERLYKKARRGEELERPSRRVKIFELELMDFSEGPPRAMLNVRCSGGTYVRTLVHDLGLALGCGAHLESLRRVEAGGFSISEAVALKDAGADSLLPLAEAVRELPRLEIDADAARVVATGAPLELTAGVGDGDALAIVHTGELLAVYRRRGGRIEAERVVSQ
jgi:tRNA pseudouridine55 synthase